MAKIYTKTGDEGTTGSLYGRMSKSDQLAHTLGTVDELNSWIGLVRSQINFFELELKNMQNNLLIIGSNLAGSKSQKLKPTEVIKLEKLIDKLTADLPVLHNFIFPIGQIHVARTICRRLEREVVALEIKDKNTLKYLNRLSDALFTMARWVNNRLGIAEEVWKG